MNALDIIIVIVYSIGMLGLGFFFKGQKDKKDFFSGRTKFWLVFDGFIDDGLATFRDKFYLRGSFCRFKNQRWFTMAEL